MLPGAAFLAPSLSVCFRCYCTVYFNTAPFTEGGRGVSSDIVINKPLTQWSCLTESELCIPLVYTYADTHTYIHTLK